MKKRYQPAHVEIQCAQSGMIMWPSTTGTIEPHTPAPKKHFVPGPGQSYDPQGSIV